MNRLTKEQILNVTANKQFIVGERIYGKTMFVKMTAELLEYKDIEEKLGIDLITLFKAFQNGIWYKNNGEITKMYISDIKNLICWNDMEISIFEGIVYYFNWRDDLYINEEKYVKDYKSHSLYNKAFNTAFYNCHLIKIKDYGKTWALTKKEFEKS